MTQVNLRENNFKWKLCVKLEINFYLSSSARPFPLLFNKSLKFIALIVSQSFIVSDESNNI